MSSGGANVNLNINVQPTPAVPPTGPPPVPGQPPPGGGTPSIQLANPAVLAFSVALYGAQQAIGLFVDAVRTVDDALNRLASNAAEYDPAVALATATATIADTLGEMERSSQLSTALSDYVLARSEFSLEMKQIGTTLAQVLAPAATEIVNQLSGILKEVNRAFNPENVKGVLDSFWKNMNLDDPLIRTLIEHVLNGVMPFGGKIIGLLDDIRKSLDSTDDLTGDFWDMYQQFIGFGSWEQWKAGTPGDARTRPHPASKLGVF